MSLEIEFTNYAMNLNISPEKAITGECLLTELRFLEELQNKIVHKRENIWCDVRKTKMLVWFSTYDEKDILKSQVFNLILHMSNIFGEYKKLRFFGWCANYVMETNSDFFVTFLII